MDKNTFELIGKVCSVIITEVSEKLSDINDNQKKIRIVMYSFIGAVIGIYALSEIENARQNDTCNKRETGRSNSINSVD